ncbi:MAG: response regulator [Lachnospiraceae bacterium]|nr:response regulator [Lachnospiraceae bacterium]
MIQQIYDRFFGDQVSNDRRVFNSIHVISIIGLIFTTFLVYIYIPGRIVLYSSVGIVLLCMLTLVEANRIDNTKIPVIIMSSVFNYIFLPLAYLSYGRVVCVIPVYFIFGLLYCALLLSDKWGLILTIVQTVFYIALIIYGSSVQASPLLEGQELLRDYTGAYVAVVVSGFVGGLAVRNRIIIQEKERIRADQLHEMIMKDYITKDIFLVNMSHEIRTPMNAIVGTVNLLLEQNVNDRVRDGIYNILNSCNALLSITNELLDTSKTDIQQVTVNTGRYDLKELLLEIINMITVRLMGSEVDLYVEISDKVPRYLYGDASKIRQLFINLLNNAVKYTRTGRIDLKISTKVKSNEEVLLCVDVKDTGIGIKEENLPKLFLAYERVQEGEKAQRGVEGTGLGLAICQEILNKLGGEIRVKSEYHVGSTFSFFVPQKADMETMLVEEIKAGEMRVLLYEKDEEAQEYLQQILELLKVPYYCPEDTKDFEENLLSRQYSHLFLAYERYMENIKFLDTMIRNEKLVMITDISHSAPLYKYGCVIHRPAHVLNARSALTNESNNYVHEIIRKGGFTCPDATILVVDDNLTNLTVAQGLLKKYEATILTALSGMECLNILENSHVDMIFLDYMMPEMNGIDTLIKIREMDDPQNSMVPVVALTANVVNGAKEMFIEAGFDDYISKPVQIDRLERTLKTFLPREMIIAKN